MEKSCLSEKPAFQEKLNMTCEKCCYQKKGNPPCTAAPFFSVHSPGRSSQYAGCWEQAQKVGQQMLQEGATSFSLTIEGIPHWKWELGPFLPPDGHFEQPPGQTVDLLENQLYRVEVRDGIAYLKPEEKK